MWTACRSRIQGRLDWRDITVTSIEPRVSRQPWFNSSPRSQKNREARCSALPTNRAQSSRVRPIDMTTLGRCALFRLSNAVVLVFLPLPAVRRHLHTLAMFTAACDVTSSITPPNSPEDRRALVRYNSAKNLLQPAPHTPTAERAKQLSAVTSPPAGTNGVCSSSKQVLLNKNKMLLLLKSNREQLCTAPVHRARLYGSSLSFWAVPTPRGFGMLSPLKQNFKTPQIEITNATSQEFLSDFRILSPPIEDFLATVLFLERAENQNERSLNTPPREKSWKHVCACQGYWNSANLLPDLPRPDQFRSCSRQPVKSQSLLVGSSRRKQCAWRACFGRCFRERAAGFVA